MSGRLGVLALGRATFDVPFAEAVTAQAFASLDRLGIDVVGPRELLLDADATDRAGAAIAEATIDLLLVLQVTFTDAAAIVRLAQIIDAPLALWAFPEPRNGGRLRLNSLCGLNLAAHALGRIGRTPRHLYMQPDAADAETRLRALLEAGPLGSPPQASTIPPPREPAAAAAALRGLRLGVLGHPPDGFDTCRFNPTALRERLGVAVEPIELETVFERARGIGEDRVDRLATRAERELVGLDAVERAATRKSLGLYAAMRDLAAEHGLAGLAVRCWPETFTEHGCAACRPMAMLGEEGIPCACEADVLGEITSLLLQEIAREPAWLVDLVDLDPSDDTGVVWHCGLAPLSMARAEPPPRADIHSNRRLPLLAAFPLRPGRVTLARVSQAGGELRLVVAGGEVTEAPASFSGTCGVVRFDAPADLLLGRIVGLGLEHHLSIAYGDHRQHLRELAGTLALPLVELT